MEILFKKTLVCEKGLGDKIRKLDLEGLTRVFVRIKPN